MDYHGLPTPRTTLAASYVAVLVWCKSCRHQAQAEMQKLIDAGRGTCRSPGSGSGARTAAAA